ncbi:MAG: HD domain-containing protein [Bacteroidales bacterium]|nr:HD domain-containing protein [Bacteroidales bacterium]
MTNKKKIINDPVHGFINIPGGIIYELIEHPYFQRLRRIKQLGLSFLVYPGAVHTRFQHAIGSMHLIGMAIEVIRSKNHEITEEESEAAKIAILLHDIGHGPFSHALENCFTPGLHHEDLSLLFMQKLNTEFDNKLDLAIKIFKNQYHKKFLHQLISGQLDMDRLDYLKRDSFFTGVSEGVVGSERIIKMLQIVDDNLVVESKGIYSIEKFLIARRLMYWQVYLHKTSLIAELLLSAFIKRLKYLFEKNNLKTNNPYIDLLIDNNKNHHENNIINNFSMIDDYDIVYLLKQNIYSEDKILSHLSDSILNRKFPKILISKEKPEDSYIDSLKQKAKSIYQLTDEELTYFIFTGEVSNNAYTYADERINILYPNKLTDISEASDMLNISVLGKIVKKYYVCAPKDVINLSV